MQLALMNFFHQCTYGHKLNTDADSNFSAGKQNDAFQAEQIWLGI
jgi:hypothetical protein